MTSERLKASLGSKCLQVASILLLSAGFAQASPEAQLRSLIGGSPELARVFGQALILSNSPTRAETSVETGDGRQAIVLFRQREMNARVGSLYCHAALSRRERLAATEKLIQIAEGDALVADFLGKTYSHTVQLTRVEDWTVQHRLVGMPWFVASRPAPFASKRLNYLHRTRCWMLCT